GLLEKGLVVDIGIIAVQPDTAKIRWPCLSGAKAVADFRQLQQLFAAAVHKTGHRRGARRGTCFEKCAAIWCGADHHYWLLFGVTAAVVFTFHPAECGC